MFTTQVSYFKALSRIITSFIIDVQQGVILAFLYLLRLLQSREAARTLVRWIAIAALRAVFLLLRTIHTRLIVASSSAHRSAENMVALLATGIFWLGAGEIKGEKNGRHPLRPFFCLHPVCQNVSTEEGTTAKLGGGWLYLYMARTWHGSI